MDAKVRGYVPYIFRCFQGFKTRDIKEYIKESRLEIHLESDEDRVCLCNVCGKKLGAKKDSYFVRAKHVRAMGWSAEGWLNTKR